jgi:hypothetical protein
MNKLGNENEQIQLALVSSDLNIQEKLSNSKSLNVRRALARNKSINSSIADKLLYDPVMNVSYVASFNPNKTRDRVFEDRYLTACVKCDIQENKLNCSNCKHYVDSVA